MDEREGRHGEVATQDTACDLRKDHSELIRHGELVEFWQWNVLQLWRVVKRTVSGNRRFVK